jgi:hypothetical protein
VTRLVKAAAVTARTTKDLRALRITRDPSKTEELQLAESHLGPLVVNALTALRFSPDGSREVGTTEAVQMLEQAARAVRANDMSGPEALLVGQAMSLNILYAELARRAAVNMGQNIEVSETYLRLALRAQNQSRATIETLGTLRNPPVVYAKQANFANQQQVNNGPGAFAGASPSAGERTEKGMAHAIELDAGAEGGPGRTDQAVQAVGALDGTPYRGGQAAVKSERLQGRSKSGSARAKASAPQPVPGTTGGSRLGRGKP